MYDYSRKLNNPLVIFIAIAGWFAIIFQFYLAILNRKLSLPGTIVQFFSYFTILTNLIVAICTTYIAFKLNSTWGRFFSKPGILTAITLYIVVVGLVYNFILRFLWAPQGLQKVVDELLHTLIPLLFLLYWSLFVPKEGLQWKQVFRWLLFPFIYSIYILGRGTFTGLYPYPFMDVVQLGYKSVLINCAYLVIVFLFGALLFVGVGKVMATYSNKNSRFQ